MAERSLPSSKFGLSTDFTRPQDQGKSDLFFHFNIYPPRVRAFCFGVHYVRWFSAAGFGVQRNPLCARITDLIVRPPLDPGLQSSNSSAPFT